MKILGRCVAICLMVCHALYTHAEGCEYDTQCKGDRICENSKCVSPPAVPAEKPAAAGFSLFGSSNKSKTPPADPPYYCCTANEVLGPYDNDGSEGKIFHVGDACSGISRNARHVTGKVCEKPAPQ